MIEGTARLGRLGGLLDRADVVHAQNVMNPEALRRLAGTGRAVVTVQDHRFFCPGQGKSLPDGSRCETALQETDCSWCIADSAYRERAIQLTLARRDAIRDARRVVLSRYMADELCAVGLGGAAVIPPWFSVAPPKEYPGRGFVMGGRLVRHKGFELGLKAWQRAGQPHTMTVVGEGPLQGSFSNCEMPGWLGRGELAVRLRRARALVFPAVWQEPFGMIGVEALAQGTPVVVAETGGVGDWARQGVVRVPAGDVGAMADAVAALAKDGEWARELGEQGRCMVARNFDRRTLEARLAHLYAEVVVRRMDEGVQ